VVAGRQPRYPIACILRDSGQDEPDHPGDGGRVLHVVGEALAAAGLDARRSMSSGSSAVTPPGNTVRRPSTVTHPQPRWDPGGMHGHQRALVDTKWDEVLRSS
jgi:hypothetical protein